MAKMMNRKERKIRRVVGKGARIALGAIDAIDVARNPPKYIIKKTLESAAKVDKVKMRRGQVKRREQFLNPRNGRYYVRDPKTKKILYGGKKSPYKGIRMPRRRRKR